MNRCYTLVRLSCEASIALVIWRKVAHPLLGSYPVFVCWLHTGSVVRSATREVRFVAGDHRDVLEYAKSLLELERLM